MAEKLKDAEDRLLESMFKAEPIDDDGFSRRIVTRIRHRIWLRRLALPVAMLVGGAIAIKPASELAIAASKLLTVVPKNLIEAPVTWLPEVQGAAFGVPVLQTVVLGFVLVAVGIFGSRIILD
jgi:hypothetical protein